MFGVYYRSGSNGRKIYVRVFEHEIDAADYVDRVVFALDSYGIMRPLDYGKC